MIIIPKPPDEINIPHETDIKGKKIKQNIFSICKILTKHAANINPEQLSVLSGDIIGKRLGADVFWAIHPEEVLAGKSKLMTECREFKDDWGHRFQTGLGSFGLLKDKPHEDLKERALKIAEALMGMERERSEYFVDLGLCQAAIEVIQYHEDRKKDDWNTPLKKYKR